MPITVLVVDDEELARRRVIELLEYEPDFRVVGEAADGEAAISMVETLRPDVLFLDIQMPEMNGFEVLDALSAETLPVVVFITAFDEFAVQAFEASAVDYLLKPFHGARLKSTLARVREHFTRKRDDALAPRLHELFSHLPVARRYTPRFVIRTGNRVYFVPAEEVRSIEADGNYVHLNTGGKKHIMRGTIGGLIERLDPDLFLRVHRSAIVNVHRLQEVQLYGRGTYILLLEDGTKIQSSITYRDGIEKLIAGAA